MARILIIDDERSNRLLLAKQVAHAGHVTLFAAGGAEGLAILAREPIDLVLLEMKMPGLDGMVVLGELRKQGMLPRLPVIVVTAHDDHQARIGALSAGASDFVIKPVNHVELLCRIRTLLELKELRDAAAAAARETRADPASSREALEALMAWVPDYVLQVDRDGTIRYLNRALPSLQLEEMIGSSWFSYFPPDQAAAMRATLESVLETGRIATSDATFVTRDGTRLSLSRRIGPLRTGDRITGAVVVTRDVTAERAAADALAGSERLQRATLDALSASVAVLDAAGNIVATNQRWRDFATANSCDWRTVSEGSSYLDVCDRAAAGGDAEARCAAQAIREVLAGKQETWLREYPCHAPEEERWYYCRITRFAGEGPIRVAVAHEEITELKRAQQLLAESDERFRSLASVAPVGFFQARVDGRLEYVNLNWCALTGVAAEQAPGQECWQAVHPVDRPLVVEDWRRYLEEGATFDTECRLVRADGQFTWVQARAAPLRDTGGAVAGHVGTLVDITDQKQTASALQTINASSAGAGAEDYFHVLARQLAQLVNAEFGCVGRLHGATRDRVQTLAVWADGAFVANFVYDLAGTPCQGVFDRNESILHPSGLQERFPEDRMLVEMGAVSYAAVPLFDSSGRAQGLIAVLGRKPLSDPARIFSLLRLHGVRASAELEKMRSNERFVNLFEFAPDAMLITGQDGTITLMNRQAEQIFGWSRCELVGQTVEILVPEAARQAHVTQRTSFLQSPGQRTMAPGRPHLMAVRRDGSVFPVDISLSPMDSEDGPVVAAAIRDLTDRVRVESQLQAVEEQLRESQRMDAIGRLAGGVAHDFNNLLTVMLGHAQLAIETPGIDPDMDASLRIIERAGRRGANLTRQLLAFSRKQILQPRVLDANAAVSEIETMCRRVLPESIALNIALDPRAGKIRADPGQLHQVLMNLVVNARDAMPRGGTLTIRTDRLDDRAIDAEASPVTGSSGQVRIRVSDDGCGMDEETRARIFEPFFTTKSKDQGTGLGLSTVFGIITQSHGRIEVESKVGNGTTFTILLPRVDGGPDAAAKPPPSASPVASDQTILLVEDDPEVRALAAICLRSSGYVVLEADGAPAALSIARRPGQRLDLLLTDVILRGQNGVSLASELVEQGQEIRVVFMSGYTDDQLAHSGVLDAGVTLLEKPFSRLTLISKVRESLSAATPWRNRSRRAGS